MKADLIGIASKSEVRCGEEGSRMLLRLWACARKRMVMPKGEEQTEEEVREGEDKSKVLFFTQCLLDMCGEFGQAIWSFEERSGLERAISSCFGPKGDKMRAYTWGLLKGCVNIRNK